MIVMKFGGTSVEDARAMARVAAIVHRRLPEAPVVIVSAMAGVTDQLLAMCQRAGQGDGASALQLAQALRRRHLDTAGELLGPKLSARLRSRLDGYCDLIEDLLRGIAATGELTPRSLDAVVSQGELLSSSMVEAVLRHRGMDSALMDARECIVTDAVHTNAAPLLEETQERLLLLVKPLLAHSRVPVMGGFVGATREGVPTTIGRGGSDLSAAIVGAALGVKRIEIWTDVPGVMTTDPALCPEARHIKVMSFQEAAELAYFGAKVLHPATLLPAMEKNIPVHVMNSRDPGGQGTCIKADAPRNRTLFKAIAAKKGVTIANISATRKLRTHSFLRSVFEVFDRHRCPVDMVATSEVSVSVTVDSKDAVPALLSDLQEVAQVSFEHDQAIVCMIGENIRGRPGIAAKVFSTVAAGGINVRMISQGASEINIGFVIEKDDVPEAVRRLHARFFPARRPRSRARPEAIRTRPEAWLVGAAREELHGS